MKYPKIAVILLNYNNAEKHTIPCINSLLANKYPKLKIVIIDNHSPNEYERIQLGKISKKHPEIINIFLDDSYGFSLGNNVGLTWAINNKIDYCWILNNDTVVIPTAISSLLEHFLAAKLNPENDIITSIITYFDNDTIWYNGCHDIPFFNFVKSEDKNRLFEDLKQVKLGLKKTQYGTGCSLFFSIELIKMHGLLHPDFYFYADDLYFTQNRNIYVIQEPLVRHKVSSTLGIKGSSRFSQLQAFWYVRSSIVYYFKYKKINIYEKLFYLLFTQPLITLLYIRDYKSFIEQVRGIKSAMKYLIFNIPHPYTRKIPKLLNS